MKSIVLLYLIAAIFSIVLIAPTNARVYYQAHGRSAPYQAYYSDRNGDVGK